MERQQAGVWRAQLQEHLQKQLSKSCSEHRRETSRCWGSLWEGLHEHNPRHTIIVQPGLLWATWPASLMRGQQRSTNTWRGGFSNGRVQSLQQQSSAPASSLYAPLNIIINIWRGKKEGSKWGVAIATVTSKEYERYGTTLTEGMFYLLFPILNVQQSYAAGHCCAGWRPSLGTTCISLVGSAWREAPHFQCWQAGPKANSPISTATSAPNSSACWWSALPLLNYNMPPIYKLAK